MLRSILWHGAQVEVCWEPSVSGFVWLTTSRRLFRVQALYRYCWGGISVRQCQVCVKAGLLRMLPLRQKTQPVSFVNWQTLNLEALSLEFQPSQRQEHRCNFEPRSSRLDGFLPDRALEACHLCIRDLLPRILNKRGSVYTELEQTEDSGFRFAF